MTIAHCLDGASSKLGKSRRARAEEACRLAFLQGIQDLPEGVIAVPLFHLQLQRVKKLDILEKQGSLRVP
jgi:hypothetical protein